MTPPMYFGLAAAVLLILALAWDNRHHDETWRDDD